MKNKRVKILVTLVLAVLAYRYVKKKKENAISIAYEKNMQKLRAFSLSLYKKLDVPEYSENDEHYNKLSKMSDPDFIIVHEEFARILNDNAESGTLGSWLKDNAQTMEAYNCIESRLTDLNLN